MEEGRVAIACQVGSPPKVGTVGALKKKVDKSL